ncbi:MAG TPA: ectonucleotide pyrophosphatase/phosphodiesterase, partial [Lysobacter sp.]|nr:ectonucleotide pyrophosphatase/phosphodiesterase [Lysobacter sp.]
MIRPLVAALLVATLAACTTTPPPSDTPPSEAVVLVSLDGFRAGDLGRGLTPNLDALARDGVRAEYMRPSYPSLTFPNHYTLVTGLRPDRHGIVHNTIHDPGLGVFTVGDESAVGDARWWGGEPIWSTAEKAGIRSATMFWPGSSAPIGGVRPTEWRPYDGSFPPSSRIEAVLGWLDAPAGARVRLVTLYFDDVDHASHDHGPDSPEARAAIRKADGYIGRLRAGLAARGLADRVDLIVVSDHGMATVERGHAIAVEDMAPPEIAVNVTTGQSVGFRPQPGREDEARRRLLGRHEHYTCWPRDALPARWRFGGHSRVPPILCQMDEGWDAVKRAWLPARQAGHARGSHGYDPALPSMRALFVADGPSFRDGAVVPGFDNVDVYPLLARLLGVAPRP